MDEYSGPEDWTTDVDESDLRRALYGEGETYHLTVEEPSEDVEFPGSAARRTPQTGQGSQ